jgi:hypothetical protein
VCRARSVQCPQCLCAGCGAADLISTQNQLGDDGLEVGMAQHTNFNTGVYFVRASPGAAQALALEGWA